MWLLETTALQTLEFAVKNFKMSDEQQAEYFAAAGVVDIDPSRILSVGGGVAHINISGLLTKGRNFMSMFMGGGTTYGEIIAAVAAAEQDEDVETITLNIDSPGGEMSGMFAAMDAIASTTKPTDALISNMGASAAYGLASQADKIVAANRGARIGSIGVAASFFVHEQEVKITSTKSPKKRPDVTTKEGKAVIREELDAHHDLFVEAISKGRKITKKAVNKDFGQGATVLADKALTSGMIDSIAESTDILPVGSTDDDDENMETGLMNIQELLAQHPEIYAAAVKIGTDAERDRCNAHLTMGEASGDMVTALAAVEDGSAMTSALQAKYMAAGMNRKDVVDREGDEATAADATASAAAAPEGDEAAEYIAAGIEDLTGVTGNA